MTTPAKPTELWILNEAIEDNIPNVLKHEPTRHTASDFFHVVDAKAYKAVVKALKEFALGESQFLDGVECMHKARETLRDLGEEIG